MEQYIKKSDIVAELNRLIAELVEEGEDTMFEQGRISAFEDVKVFINHTIEVEENGETAEAFARIIRANLTGIGKDVQYKFEQLYKEITGEKMYQGYND